MILFFLIQPNYAERLKNYETIIDTSDEIQLDGVIHAKSISDTSTMINQLRFLAINFFQKKLHIITNGEAKTHLEYYFKESKKCLLFDESKTINIKRHLIRPVQYIIYGLCLEAKIHSHAHDMHELPEQLEMQGKIKPQTRKSMQYILSVTYQERRQLHAKNGKECDEIKEASQDILAAQQHVNKLLDTIVQPSPAKKNKSKKIKKKDGLLNFFGGNKATLLAGTLLLGIGVTIAKTFGKNNSSTSE